MKKLEKRKNEKTIIAELNEKIDGKYPWYFLNIREERNPLSLLKPRMVEINLYGFDEKPKHDKKKEGIFDPKNNDIRHEIYSEKLDGIWVGFSIDSLPSNLKRYTKYNMGAEYKA